MDRSTIERHALLARQARSPLDLLIEVARCVEPPAAEPEQALRAALELLARELGFGRLALELADRGEALDVRRELCGGAVEEVRIPIVRRQAQLGTLCAQLPAVEGGVPMDRLRVLPLAAAVLAEAAGELAARPLAPAQPAGSATFARPALLGDCPAVQAVRRSVEQAAGVDLSVLIVGESGTGKESVARAIHEESAHASGPFVVLSSAGSPEWLASWVRSAAIASGAPRATLFVDEIGELSPALQAELLDALRCAEHGPNGRAVRVIAATHLDLVEAVTEGRFRKDLYYRVSEFPIVVPPLRERRADLPQLAAQFLVKHAALQRKSVTRISEPALELLLAHAWPGNVRELENCVSRAVLLAHYGVVRQHHLPAALQPSSLGLEQPRGLRARVERFERELIARTLERTEGNRAAAAQLLGTTARVLAYRMQRLNP